MKPKHCGKAMVGIYKRMGWILVGYYCNKCHYITKVEN